MLLARLRRLVVRRTDTERSLDELFQSGPVRLVAAESVTRTLAGMEPVAADGERERVYREYLRTCLVDHRLSDEELLDLAHLRSVLELDDRVITRVNRQVAREVYSRSVEDVIADGRIDEHERHFLLELRARLEIPEPIADNILEVKKRQRLARTEPRLPRRD